jgi:hypothetical protein
VICGRYGVEKFSLSSAVEHSAFPLGTTGLEMELETLVLKGGLEGFLVGRHFGKG